MAKQHYFFAAFLVLLLTAAGCQQAVEPQQPVQPQTQPQPETQPLPQASEAAVSILYLSSPISAEPGQSFTVEWKVDSNLQTDIIHTAVHYGIVSYPGALSAEITPQDSGYPSTAGLVTSATIPNTFSAAITAQESETTLYYRAHAIVDSKNYWAEEKTVKVTMAVTAPGVSAPPEQMPAPPASSGGGGGY